MAKAEQKAANTQPAATPDKDHATVVGANGKQRIRFADRSPEEQQKIMEERRKAFSELATTRTRVAIKRIRMLCSLGNKQNYDYTPEQAQKILTVLGDAVNEVKASLSGHAKVASGFEV